MTRIAAVLWSGVLGGAETFTVDLCRAMRTLGADARILFIAGSHPLAARLESFGIPYASLGLARGRQVIVRPRTLAQYVRSLGADGALVPRAGYLTAVLRAGGYRERVVAVAHDAVYDLGPVGALDRLVWQADRASGFWASDVDVAVSEFALGHMRRQFHAGQLVRIYNGVDLESYPAVTDRVDSHRLTIGSASRLIEGKGIDVLIRAFAAGPAAEGARLRIAGVGPELSALIELVARLNLRDAVEFLGPITDIAGFWQTCDVAAQPSSSFIESFGMAAVEAMSSARPVVASANGALPEVVQDGVTGTIVPPGNVDELARALLDLIRDPEQRRMAGAAARQRCEQHFDILKCAASYLELFRERTPS